MSKLLLLNDLELPPPQDWFTFTGDAGDAIFHSLTNRLIEFARQSFVRRNKKGYKKIVLFISSAGGSLMQANAFAQFSHSLQRTHASGLELITIAKGEVESAAIIPFVMGRRRYAFNGSRFLFHEGYYNFEQGERYTVSQLHRLGDDLQKQEMLGREIISAHTGIPIAKLVSYDHRSKRIECDEAVELGFIHGKIEAGLATELRQRASGKSSMARVIPIRRGSRR